MFPLLVKNIVKKGVHWFLPHNYVSETGNGGKYGKMCVHLKSVLISIK